MVEKRTRRQFVRLVNVNDKRGPEQLKKAAHLLAFWRCIDCGEVDQAFIGSVVCSGSGCSNCTGRIGVAEACVLEFLIEVFGKDNVYRHHKLGTYEVDARIRHPLGEIVDIETDGAQHYERVNFFTTLTLEEQIARDVEKMRRSAAEFVPTVRIPTYMVTRDARDGEDNGKWKSELFKTIDAAAFAAKTASVRGSMRIDDTMFTVEGQSTKYGAHDALLRTVFFGEAKIKFGDLYLVAER
jgi:hypothetical protein